MSFAVIVLIARIGLVLALYAFLFVVVRAMYRDLQAAGASATPASPPRATGVPRLIVLTAGQTGLQAGQQFTLRNPTMLGRDSACDIRIEDDWVSAQHLRLAAVNARWSAHDLNSTNGTQLNGTRIRGSTALKSGDILDIGRLRMRFTQDR